MVTASTSILVWCVYIHTSYILTMDVRDYQFYSIKSCKNQYSSFIRHQGVRFVYPVLIDFNHRPQWKHFLLHLCAYITSQLRYYIFDHIDKYRIHGTRLSNTLPQNMSEFHCVCVISHNLLYRQLMSSSYVYDQ